MVSAQEDTSGSASEAPVIAPAGMESKDQRAKRRVVATVALCLVLCGLLEVGGRVATRLNLVSGGLRDLLGTVSMLVLGILFMYVLRRVHRLPKLVSGTLIASVVCLALFQLSDLTDEVNSLQHIPLLGKGYVLHVVMENLVATFGALLLIAGLLYAIIELDWMRRRLDADREQLALNMTLCTRVQNELQHTRDRLEAQVTQRTGELAERNTQLQIELEERQRAEATLERRLRFEEGLAACLQTLQADLDPAEALERALGQLRDALQTSRVCLFENERDADGRLLAMRLCEARDPELPLTPAEKLWSSIAYEEMPEAWRNRLSRGGVLSASLGNDTDAVLVRLGVSSFLALPIGWEGGWRGFLAFIDTLDVRVWSREEVGLLQTAAEVIGAFKERLCAEEVLRRAHESLERRVAERTADLTYANQRLQQEISDRRRAEREKEKLEAQLRQAEKMKAIGTLAGGIAHDFNNILSSILGFTEMALLKVEKDFPYRRYLDEVYKAGNRAKELVRQILVFSRQSEEDRTPINMYELVEETLALLRPALPENIELRKRLGSECGTVMADPIQMHQVVMNLCTNAEHAMRGTGGILDVSLDRVTFAGPVATSHGTLLPGTYVVLTVSDSGHGMTPETLERVFEPFFTTKSVGEGTGMGLAIVHGIVTSIGGAITAESEHHKGSTFRIYLPFHHGSARPDRIPASEMPGGTEHILVVDDEAQLVGMWTEMLHNFGYQVTAYTHSVSALDAFEREPAKFDLALLDQTMPGLTGTQIAQRMLELRPDFPIILATGFSDTVTSESAEALGIREFIFKPIIAKDLAHAIRNALSPAGTDR